MRRRLEGKMVPGLLLALLGTGDALACAGFYHEDGASAESDTQRVVFERDGAEVVATYGVDVRVDTGAFGWVIPAAGEVVDVADGDVDLFRALDQVTSPLLDLAYDDGGGCGPMPKSGNDRALSGANSTEGVDVVQTGATPTYSYAVLEATSADALRAWLTDNGWGDGGGAFEGYVGDGWQFVAVQLALDVDELVEATIPPLSIRYAGDQLVYPSRMGLGAMDPMLATTVYVVGDSRARVASGWSETPLEVVGEAGEDADYVQYGLYPEELEAIGAARGFAVTYAGPWEDAWVTRFDTRAAPAVHTEDAVFDLDGGDDELHTVITNVSGCGGSGGAAWLLLAPLAWLTRRARSR